MDKGPRVTRLPLGATRDPYPDHVKALGPRPPSKETWKQHITRSVGLPDAAARVRIKSGGRNRKR
jgi:hypothetical protein